MEFKRTTENRIWIRGNDADPGQVISVLEARGGRNTEGLHGGCADIAYYISDDGVIRWVPLDCMSGVWLQEAWGELHLKTAEHDD
jgi:hypothetical protein